MARPDGLYGHFCLWGKDAEDQSSNYRELRNLVETVEEEAMAGYLTGGSFGCSLTTRQPRCFFQGSYSPKLLHELVLRLRKTDLEYDLTLHVVHVQALR